MLCPKCNGRSSVVDSRSYENTIRRKRICQKCKYSYRTLEVLEPPKSKEPPKLKLVKPKKRKLKQKKKPTMFELEHLTDEELEAAVLEGQVRFDEDEI
jgi:transcriptional regulator NrdR family protein